MSSPYKKLPEIGSRHRRAFWKRIVQESRGMRLPLNTASSQCHAMRLCRSHDRRPTDRHALPCSCRTHRAVWRERAWSSRCVHAVTTTATRWQRSVLMMATIGSSRSRRRSDLDRSRQATGAANFLRRRSVAILIYAFGGQSGRLRPAARWRSRCRGTSLSSVSSASRPRRSLTFARATFFVAPVASDFWITARADPR